MAKKKKKKVAIKESVNDTVARAKAMLAQTKAEGSKSFASSSYNKSSSVKTPTVAPKTTGSTGVGLTPAQVESLKNTPGIDQAALGNYVSSGAVNTSGYANLKDMSIGLANGQTPTTPTPTTPSPEDYAKSVMDALSQNNPDTSGVGTQSTQGDASAGVQPGVNDAVAGAAGAVGAPGGGTTITSSAGPGITDPALMSGGTPMATVATGGYQKIGPAYFQKTSDGMRAVSDPSIISGLKHGTIPYTTGQLDGTTFSKYSVPLAPTASTTITPPGSSTNQGAGLMNTYESYQQKYGLPQDQTSFFSDPKGTITAMTEEIYKITGMEEANRAIRGITEDLEDLENERDDKIADVNDNPWLTEGVRLRQIASIESRYEDRIANHTNKLRLLEDVRNNAQQQAQFAIGTAISLWDKERTFQQHQIDSWNEQAQREFTNKMAIMNYERGNYEFDASYALSKFNADTAAYNAAKGREIDWYNAETARINALKTDTNGLDAVTARTLRESVSANDELIRLATKYKGIIQTKGFSYSGPGGDRDTAGEVASLRGQMVSAYKKAQTLGTLDAGVIALMDSILGETPISSTWAPLTNITGGRQEKLISSVDSLLEGLIIQRNRDASRLGMDPYGTAAPSNIWESPSGNVYNLPMTTNSTSTQ